MVMGEGRKSEFAVKLDVLGCGVGVFLQESVTLWTDWIRQNRLFSVSQQREAN